MADYTRIPTKITTEQDMADDALVEIQGNQFAYGPEEHKRRYVHGFKLYAILVSILLCSLFIFGFKVRPASTALTDNLTSTTYGIDLRYQTLDHAQDKLWDFLNAEQSGYIALDRNQSSTDRKGGLISM